MRKKYLTLQIYPNYEWLIWKKIYHNSHFHLWNFCYLTESVLWIAKGTRGFFLHPFSNTFLMEKMLAWQKCITLVHQAYCTGWYFTFLQCFFVKFDWLYLLSGSVNRNNILLRLRCWLSSSLNWMIATANKKYKQTDKKRNYPERKLIIVLLE